MSEDVAPVQPGETDTDSTAPPEAPRRRRWPLVVALILSFALFASAGAFAGATVSYADSLAGRLLPGTMIAGVDVGGMSTQEALVAVRGTLTAQLDRRIVMRWGERRWTARAGDLGAQTNAKQIIQQVRREQSGLSWQDWARLRWLGERADEAAQVAVVYPRRAAVRFVARAARDIRAEPVDATLDIEGADVIIGPSSVGYALAPGPVVTQVLAALRGRRANRPIALRPRTIKPEVTEKDFSEVLLLDQSEHRLTLFSEGTKTHSWIVATGTGDYPTPLGRYSITEKRYLPTWVNPSPDDWGKDMPESIPPGPGNPLGLRALNWDAPAIRFHGTSAIDTLGTDASHGCVRMSNDDVIALYDLVEVGAVIISQE